MDLKSFLGEAQRVFWLISIFYSLQCCCNPNLGLTTKVKACKVAGQEGSLRVMLHVPGSARKCEGIDPHTPKGTPT